MPFRKIPGTDTTYALIAFDKDGRERTDDDPDGVNGLMTARLLEDVKSHPPTNIFLFSHGWKGDMPAAIDQYNRWIEAMLDRTGDISRMKAANPGFDPLYIGLHWPSLPWGDDELAPAGFATGDTPVVPLDTLKNKYLERLGDTPQIRGALDVIFKEARENAAATELSPEVVAAYHQLNAALDLTTGQGVAAPPDADREPFDPEQTFQNAQAESAASFGGFDCGGDPRAVASAVVLDDEEAGPQGRRGRACIDFIAALQQALPHTRFHLMGHSFGCIVVSSILLVPAKRQPLPPSGGFRGDRPGGLLAVGLLRGHPRGVGRPGFYNAIVSGQAVRGPVVTTRSKIRYTSRNSTRSRRACSGRWISMPLARSSYQNTVASAASASAG